jgi:hypothetical protein
VQINMCTGGVSNTDRLWFFKNYLDQDPSAAPKRKQWSRTVMRKTELRLARKGRCLGD